MKLSHHLISIEQTTIWISLSRDWIHTISTIVLAILLYSDYVPKHEIIGYFLANHITRFVLRKIPKLDMDFWSSLPRAQLTSTKAVSANLFDLLNSNPYSIVYLRYVNILYIAIQWVSLGEDMNWYTLLIENFKSCESCILKCTYNAHLKSRVIKHFTFCTG